MAELIWKVGFDEQSATRAGKQAAKAQSKESEKSKKKDSGSSSFAGGFVGSILGQLLSSVKALFDPLAAIASLLVAALFPILKPFLILFIRVGLLLYKWLNAALGGVGSKEDGISVNPDNGQASVGDSLKSALFIIGGIIGAIIAVLAGAPILLVAGIALLGGLLLSQVGGFLIQVLLNFVTWIDKIFGTNFLSPVKTFFDGVANVFNGLWNILVSLLSLDFKGAWEGLQQVLLGAWQMLKGALLFNWELLKAILLGTFVLLKSILIGTWNLLKTAFIESFGVVKGMGQWIFDYLKKLLTTSFSVLSNLGQSIKDSIKGFFGGGSGNSTSVEDAIITPNGDLIRSSPSDYTVFTKNPGLFGGGGNSSQKMEVNINGGLITEDVANQIGRIIQRQIGYGGGFN